LPGPNCNFFGHQKFSNDFSAILDWHFVKKFRSLKKV
jgi:hypothetical protein